MGREAARSTVGECPVGRRYRLPMTKDTRDEGPGSGGPSPCSRSLGVRSGGDRRTADAGYWRCAASAASASALTPAKKSGDCPLNSPIAVRNVAAPTAAPSVLVGRMIEQIGNLRSRKLVGSGMIRLGLNSGPRFFRSGKVSPVLGSVSGG